VPETRFSFIFATELYGRLVWFGRLRWLAAVGLASASFLGPRLGLPAAWPSLFVIASFVGCYNLVFQRMLKARKSHGEPYMSLRAIAISEMVMDLASLMVTAHFTGGLHSPLLAFFAFHMAIGTIMIATRIMFVLAAATSVGALAFYLLQSQGILRAHPIDPGGAHGASGALNLLSLVVAMFGIVYLTDSVTSRFKQRNIEIYETTKKLGERTGELQYLLGEVERLEQRKSHYMRISAHQLRSPLGTVRTSLQVLTEGFVEPASERGRKLLLGAVERVDGLLAIVNDLLDLAKIREGRGKAPWVREVNVNQLLADLFDSMDPYAEERKVKMVPDFEGVAVLAWGIPPDLVYAFENLMHNGLKYSEAGGTLSVSLRTSSTAVVVRVTDDGIGIPADLVDQVFLEFVRAPNAKRHAPEGTGLGLPIVKEVIEAHGGRISAASKEGEGTTFTVTLPLKHIPPEVEKLLQEGNDGGYRRETATS
jgi:signal transduction histidine kinase